ncbi:hypothetical protein NQ176_g5522 [Zarea fungicola]|uniref:Uncharacterized protein n=1 Tax=Zarea fungicola TaxID=93591 RepID=A0ACC1N8X2_9HYPO|nr:hypothetical protein NQ176_g5522 [Lecanicillium fungicola]
MLPFGNEWSPNQADRNTVPRKRQHQNPHVNTSRPFHRSTFCSYNLVVLLDRINLDLFRLHNGSALMASETSTVPMTSAMRGSQAFTIDSSVAYFETSMDLFRSSHRDYDDICVGACVFDSSGKQLLLIQRAACDSFPSMWEIPGGRCDPDDKTILHSLARELFEETGLVLRHVRRCVCPAQTTGANIHGEDGSRGYTFQYRDVRAIKYNFLVEVESPLPIRLNPDEHMAFSWLTVEEYRSRQLQDQNFRITTPAQADLISEAFDVVHKTPDKL